MLLCTNPPCNSPAVLYTCGVCKTAHYCSDTCATDHWQNGHELTCGGPTSNDVLDKFEFIEYLSKRDTKTLRDHNTMYTLKLKQLYMSIDVFDKHFNNRRVLDDVNYRATNLVSQIHDLKKNISVFQSDLTRIQKQNKDRISDGTVGELFETLRDDDKLLAQLSKDGRIIDTIDSNAREKGWSILTADVDKEANTLVHRIKGNIRFLLANFNRGRPDKGLTTANQKSELTNLQMAMILDDNDVNNIPNAGDAQGNERPTNKYVDFLLAMRTDAANLLNERRSQEEKDLQAEVKELVDSGPFHKKNQRENIIERTERLSREFRINLRARDNMRIKKILRVKEEKELVKQLMQKALKTQFLRNEEEKVRRKIILAKQSTKDDIGIKKPATQTKNTKGSRRIAVQSKKDRDARYEIYNTEMLKQQKMLLQYRAEGEARRMLAERRRNREEKEETLLAETVQRNTNIENTKNAIRSNSAVVEKAKLTIEQNREIIRILRLKPQNEYGISQDDTYIHNLKTAIGEAYERQMRAKLNIAQNEHEIQKLTMAERTKIRGFLRREEERDRAMSEMEFLSHSHNKNRIKDAREEIMWENQKAREKERRKKTQDKYKDAQEEKQKMIEKNTGDIEFANFKDEMPGPIMNELMYEERKKMHKKDKKNNEDAIKSELIIIEKANKTIKNAELAIEQNEQNINRHRKHQEKTFGEIRDDEHIQNTMRAIQVERGKQKKARKKISLANDNIRQNASNLQIIEKNITDTDNKAKLLKLHHDTHVNPNRYVRRKKKK